MPRADMPLPFGLEDQGIDFSLGRWELLNFQPFFSSSNKSLLDLGLHIGYTIRAMGLNKPMLQKSKCQIKEIILK